jgi:hypothetical protein
MKYQHTQRAPMNLILCGVGIAMLIGASQAQHWVAQIALLGGSGLMYVLALSFGSLTVRDEDDRLRIRFGPLPLFARSIVYADIESVERSRSTILDGWGIHLSLSGGWVWNLWGFDCVDVRLTRGRKVRIGTDDPEGLESFLKQRTTGNQ